MMNAEGIMARCWAFALDQQNSKLIRKLATVYAKRLGTDADDLQQELQMTVAFSFPRYRPEKGSPSNWIRWQARGLAKEIGRSRRAQDLEVVVGSNDVDAELIILLDHIPDPGAVALVEASAELHEILRQATPSQLQACEMVVLGLTDTEIRAKHGVSRQARNHHLHTLRRQAQG